MDQKRQKLNPEKVNESNNDVLGINSLPDEMILKVFGYLEQNQLGQISRVSRRWNVLTKSPLLWKNVNLKFLSFHESQIILAKSFINGLPSCVKSIRLDFTEYRGRIVPFDFTELCLRLQQKCPHIEEFILTNCKLSNILPAVIHLCNRSLLDLKNLVFHRCIFPSYFAKGEFGGISRIEVLDLSECQLIGCNKPEFSRMPCLKVLCLYGNNNCYSWFENDISFLNQLHVLNVGYARITVCEFRVILKYGLNLKELYLCFVDLKDHDITFNKSVFPHLKTICLCNRRLTCEGVVSFIQSCPSLENVYVNGNVATSFAEHPFVVANRCKLGIVKTIGIIHEHNVDYLHN